MELELKHILPFIPDGVKIQWFRDNDSTYQISDLTMSDYPFFRIKKFKLILFPISSLTKVIEVGGEKFVPDEMFDDQANGKGYHFELQNMARYKYCDGYLPFKVQMQLFEWKIDINQLIPAGLAIDVETLETNPYK